MLYKLLLPEQMIQIPYLSKADKQELLVCLVEARKQSFWTIVLDPVLVALFNR